MTSPKPLKADTDAMGVRAGYVVEGQTALNSAKTLKTDYAKQGWVTHGLISSPSNTAMAAAQEGRAATVGKLNDAATNQGQMLKDALAEYGVKDADIAADFKKQVAD